MISYRSFMGDIPHIVVSNSLTKKNIELSLLGFWKSYLFIMINDIDLYLSWFLNVSTQRFIFSWEFYLVEKFEWNCLSSFRLYFIFFVLLVKLYVVLIDFFSLALPKIFIERIVYNWWISLWLRDFDVETTVLRKPLMIYIFLLSVQETYS